MSTYARGRHRSDPDAPTHITCGWTMCTTRVTYRFRDAGVYLCQEHAVLTWAAVQDMNAAGQVDTNLPPLPKATSSIEDGRVYYLRIGDRVKIGFTADLLKRLATYPPNIEVLLVRHGSRELERQEHTRFSEHRTDGREWFHANDRVLQMISEISTGIDWDWDPEWFQRRTHTPQKVTHRKLESGRSIHGH